MTPQETFVLRLRRHRQRNRLTIEEISVETRVKVDLLEALENNDLSGWPRGLYARAWIRAYASAVGLDPIDTVDEFCRLFAHGDRRARGTIREIAAIVAAPSEYRDEFSHPEDRRRSGAEAASGVDTPEINLLQKAPWYAQWLQGATRLFSLRGADLVRSARASITRLSPRMRGAGPLSQ